MTSDERAGLVFHALSDPTRRQVVRALAERGTVTASGLASELPVTRQAVAKHLGVLRAAGLAEASAEGRETVYRLTPEPLDDARAWMASAGAAWDERLGRLAKRAARLPRCTNLALYARNVHLAESGAGLQRA